MSKTILSEKPGPIGIFDSGYGGLTILKHIQSAMPEYDFIYLGDNARTPYGTRSFQVVYEFTLQCVTKLFEMGCHLVILACNTASAKALRTIQQIDLPRLDATRRVLGIIRPTVESIGELTQSRHVGLLATPGTVIQFCIKIPEQSKRSATCAASVANKINHVTHCVLFKTDLVKS